MPAIVTHKSPLRFFLLTLALSIPFWLLDAVVRIQLLPGIPISALMVLGPVLAALWLIYREKQSAGMAELLKRAFDYPRIRSKVWYVPMLLLMPMMMTVEYGLLRWLGSPIPVPQFSLGTVLSLFVVFFVAALAEELGWMGYAVEPLQARFSALQAGILLGLVWAVWHFIPLLQVNRSWTWIAWWSLETVAQRVLIVWLYNNTGQSLFGAAVYHTMINVTFQLFPVNGSYYDPRITALIVTFVATIITIIGGAKTLARRKPTALSLRG